MRSLYASEKPKVVTVFMKRLEGLAQHAQLLAQLSDHARALYDEWMTHRPDYKLVQNDVGEFNQLARVSFGQMQKPTVGQLRGLLKSKADKPFYKPEWAGEAMPSFMKNNPYYPASEAPKPPVEPTVTPEQVAKNAAAIAALRQQLTLTKKEDEIAW